MNSTRREQRTIEEMINHISDEKTLQQFLKDKDIADIDSFYEIKTYERDGNRGGLIVKVQERNNEKMSKIMIDLKQGQPIINQVYDALYDIGKDCSARIILYTNGTNVDDKDVPAADYWVVYSLIDNLQQYPLGLHYYEMDESTFTIGPHYMHDKWIPTEDLPLDKVPTKEQFMAEAFWIVYFDSFNEAFYESHRTFTGGFRTTSDWGYIVYIDCTFFGEIQLYWDHNGVRYLVKQKNDSYGYLKKVLDYEMQGLKEHYGTDNVKFENEVGRLPRLHIKYSDKPFEWLYTANPRDITKFAESMWEDVWTLRWRIEERIDGYFKRKSA